MIGPGRDPAGTGAGFDPLMLNALLVAEVRPLLDAISVYPLPDLLTERPLKVATPCVAFTVATPSKVPPPGLAPMATVAGPAKLKPRLPPTSSACTTGCVPRGVPAAAHPDTFPFADPTPHNTRWPMMTVYVRLSIQL